MLKSVLAAALLLTTSSTALAAPIDPATRARIDRILAATPLIDGHNDIAEQIAESHDYSTANLATGTAAWPDHPLMTDMARLRAGHLGGQFWSVYIDGKYTGDEAIRRTLEQIDIIDRLIAAYPVTLERAYTADDIVRIHHSGRVASLIGIEGGRQIGGSMAALRQFYRLGARYRHSLTTRPPNGPTALPTSPNITASPPSA
jgi:membrane dipeptidase